MLRSLGFAAFAMVGAFATSACETDEDMAMWAELGGMFLDAAVMADDSGALLDMDGLSGGSGDLAAFSSILSAAAGAGDLGGLDDGSGDLAALSSLLAAAGAGNTGGLSSGGSGDLAALANLLAAAASDGAGNDPAVNQAINDLLAAAMAAGAAGGGGLGAAGPLPGSVLPGASAGGGFKPNLAATAACAGFTEANYRQMALRGGGDTQLDTMCGQAFEYYTMYKRALAQGYSVADADRTYQAHAAAARVANGFARDSAAN